MGIPSYVLELALRKPVTRAPGRLARSDHFAHVPLLGLAFMGDLETNSNCTGIPKIPKMGNPSSEGAKQAL